MSDGHSWFRTRLDAHFLGLLEEDEQHRFDEHATSCPECAAAMRAFGDHLPTARLSEHIPSRILARWDRAKRSLRGLARHLVREHLESCAACRQDLESLGFAPELETDPALEEDEAPVRGRVAGAPLAEAHDVLDGPAPRPAQGHPIVILKGHSSASRLREWLLGGAAGAALAAAILLVVVPIVSRDATRGPGQQQPTPAPPVSTVVPTPSPAAGISIQILGRAARLQEPTRGTQETPPGATSTNGSEAVIQMGRDTRFVQMSIPDLYIPDSTRLDIELHGLGGRLTSTEITHGDLGRGRTLLIGNPAKELEPGHYRLLIRAGSDPTGTPPVELRFLLEPGTR